MHTLCHFNAQKETHEDLFDVLSRQVKSITKLSIPLVTDGEKALINSIESKLSNYNFSSVLESYYYKHDRNT